MAQVLATIFLIVIIAGVFRMVLDVQMAKVKSILNEVERMQVLAGIKPRNRDRVRDTDLPGVDIEGIEQLAERFQKLAHIKEEK